MKIRAKQLDAQLRKGLAKLYAIHGGEALVALEAADRIREAARRSGCTEREIFFAEPGCDWSRLNASSMRPNRRHTRPRSERHAAK